MDILSLFSWFHPAAFFKVVGLDILLGGDNAIVIALACAALPVALRNKAIFGGTALAILFRMVLLAVGIWAMSLPYLRVVAGLALLYIGWKLVVEHNSDEDPNVKAESQVGKAILTIGVADISMSLDNVFAVIGAAETAGDHALYYAIGGVLLSIPLIVFGATIITKFLDKFPILVWAGAGLLGWVGAEMIISDPHVAGYVVNKETLVEILGFAAVILAAFATLRLSQEKANVDSITD